MPAPAFRDRTVCRAPRDPGDDVSGWVDALPVACAILDLAHGQVAVHAANADFHALDLFGRDDLGIDTALLRRHAERLVPGVRDRVHFVVEGTSPVRAGRLELLLTPLAPPDRVLLTVVDRTRERDGLSALRREMLHDTLTGFPNRAGFEDAVDQILESRVADGQDQRFAMFVVDIARFSRINACVGALAGDELLMTAARRLRAALRARDIIGRVGGNEFAIFAPLTRREDVVTIADRLARRFGDPFRLSSLDIAVDACIGGVDERAGESDAGTALRHAQLALKTAKQTRRFELYRPQSLEDARLRFSMETELRRALDANALTLAYQPLVDLDTGKITGFEMLARWHHPERGSIPPSDFIPVAEESGLIVPLGRWAIREAAATLARWDRRAERILPVRLAVNLSAVQIQRDDVPGIVADALHRVGIDGNRLTLELTESAFVADPDGARAVMAALKAMGASLAMDDFGTGYSNLAWLQRLPLDVLKIDRSFVTDMMADPDKGAIVRTVLSLARALGMRTTAEGVETVEVSDTLAGLGCSYAQGYYFARPLPEDAAFDALMRAIT